MQFGGGSDGDNPAVDFLAIARRMVGTGDEPLFGAEDMQKIRGQVENIRARIEEREQELESLKAPPAEVPEDEGALDFGGDSDAESRVEEIRQSVTDERIQERIEDVSESDAESREDTPGNENGREEER